MPGTSARFNNFLHTPKYDQRNAALWDNQLTSIDQRDARLARADFLRSTSLWDRLLVGILNPNRYSGDGEGPKKSPSDLSPIELARLHERAERALQFLCGVPPALLTSERLKALGEIADNANPFEGISLASDALRQSEGNLLADRIEGIRQAGELDFNAEEPDDGLEGPDEAPVHQPKPKQPGSGVIAGRKHIRGYLWNGAKKRTSE